MISRKLFDNLSNSLKLGFFSDDIIIILSKYKRTQKLQQGEISLLNKAKDFLSDAIKGHDWIENNVPNDQNAVYAFSQTVKVLAHIETSEQFTGYLRQLIITIDKIFEKNRIASPEIDDLIDFFTGTAKRQLQISEEIMSGDLGPSRWQLTKVF